MTFRKPATSVMLLAISTTQRSAPKAVCGPIQLLERPGQNWLGGREVDETETELP